MIWNQHLLYQIIDVWYHIRKLYLINNEKNDKIKLNHFFLQTAPHSIRLANWLESARSWRLIRFSFVTGVGINFRPRYSRVICLSVSCSFDSFLIYCLRDSMALKKRFLSLILLRSFLLRFLAALLSLRFAFPFPLLLRSLIRDKSKIHFVYSHALVISFVLLNTSTSLILVFNLHCHLCWQFSC